MIKKSLFIIIRTGGVMSYTDPFQSIFCKNPDAAAHVSGSSSYPDVSGTVRFYQMCGYMMVAAEFEGLPIEDRLCAEPVFGFHIHEGMECSGNDSDPFADAGGHYNPNHCPHPYHAGDMPPLFGTGVMPPALKHGGRAFLAFMTDRFRVNEILGRAVIIHRMSDDFRTQPSGDAGAKIGCGIIRGRCR